MKRLENARDPRSTRTKRPSGKIALGLLTVIALAPNIGKAADVEKVLHSVGPRGGRNPSGPLIEDANGVLYGTNQNGYDKNIEYSGSVYKLAPPTAGQTEWVYTPIWLFKGKTGGTSPQTGVLFGPNGTLYGATNGGGQYQGGVIFQLVPPVSGQTSWTEKILANTKGDMFGGLLERQDGSLVGTTFINGLTLQGSVFLLKPPAQGKSAWTLSYIYDFQGGSDGSYPMASLIAGPNGVLYGTTSEGGPANAGTVFSLKPAAKGKTNWTETVLYAFQGSTSQSSTDGADPVASLTLGGGVLYGTTKNGGTSGCGTVFSVTPPAGGTGAWSEAVLLAFNVTNGCYPVASLVVKPSGALVGVTSSSTNFAGVAFELTPPKDGGTGWTDETLYQFNGGIDGGAVEGALLPSGKNYFGAANSRGYKGYGVVFKLAPP